MSFRGIVLWFFSFAAVFTVVSVMIAITHYTEKIRLYDMVKLFSFGLIGLIRSNNFYSD